MDLVPLAYFGINGNIDPWVYFQGLGGVVVVFVG
jgi:hypothetical protein